VSTAPWPWGDGDAGRSARRHGSRNRSNECLPPSGLPVPLGDLLGPVTLPAPADIAAWDRGAAGEELTARILAPLEHLGWTVLHDRRVPGSSANIDHLAVGPRSVTVVDTKAWRGRVKLLGDGRLWYGRTPLDHVLATLSWVAAEVGAHLSRRLTDPVPVQALLCLHGARLPADPLKLERVTLVTGGTILAFLAGDASLSSPAWDAARVGALAADTFPPR
jgi:hypothetical protein